MVFRGTGVYRQKYAPKCPPPPPNVHRRRPKCQNRPRFPFPPQDHSCEGRNLTATCRQRRRILGGGRGMATIRRIVRTRHCEIPAYAGMVFRGTGVYRQKSAPKCPPPPPQMPKSPPIPIPPTSSFLRKQESHSAVHTNIGKSPTNLRPPEDHSCEGRNLIAKCRQRRRLLGGGRGNGDN